MMSSLGHQQGSQDCMSKTFRRLSDSTALLSSDGPPISPIL
jgi:hypothetical protein